MGPMSDPTPIQPVPEAITVDPDYLFDAVFDCISIWETTGITEVKGEFLLRCLPGGTTWVYVAPNYMVPMDRVKYARIKVTK